MNNKAKKPYETVTFEVTLVIAEDVLSLSDIDNNGYDIGDWPEEI